MKFLFGVIISLGTVACNGYKQTGKTGESYSNLFRGSIFSVKVFITLYQDTAIAEWYYYDGPLQVFSDTLIANNDERKDMKGKQSQIFYNRKGVMYFKTRFPYEPPKIIDVKMRLDNNYKIKYEQIKYEIRNGNRILF